MPIKAYYHSPVSNFLKDDDERILGVLTSQHRHSLEEQQRAAWLRQLAILRTALANQIDGQLFLEFFIPRMGKRTDSVLLLSEIVLVLEFKIGAEDFAASTLRQVEDYALDLKNFHQGSHSVAIVPILIATEAETSSTSHPVFSEDLVASPIGCNALDLGNWIKRLSNQTGLPLIDLDCWMQAGYKPTPTIIEAAQALYENHSVADISRSDASAKNLTELSTAVNEMIDAARKTGSKTICFITGVPGSGKTLAGLNIATQRSEMHHDEHAVFLSGNGPLVAVLREALTRDKAKRESIPKSVAQRQVGSFIQNIHHFRDHYLRSNEIPSEKVVVFDESQRAWTREQARAFMKRKHGLADFDMSEPEFLISVLDRHLDWCVIVCLVGGGQEINTGEAGISEWMHALETHFPKWQVNVSPRITLPEYGSQLSAEAFLALPQVHTEEHLHLSVSMRSFRAETLSDFVEHVLEGRAEEANQSFQKIRNQYPIYLTRNLTLVRRWLRQQARGTERVGLVASSGAQRLKPEGIEVKTEIDPAIWFLNEYTDVRSSFYLEDVATEFAIQGLELDWVGVCWDGDFYYDRDRWWQQAFKGCSWQTVRDEGRRKFLKNAYRVLLTRARQGMILFIPEANAIDHTRPSHYYDGTFQFLSRCGIESLT